MDAMQFLIIAISSGTLIGVCRLIFMFGKICATQDDHGRRLDRLETKKC